MTKLEAARDVAARLTAAEQAIDEALRTSAELMARLSTARRDLQLSAVVGGESFARSSAALAALTAARSETAACHDVLARLQVRAGLGAVALGEGAKPPAEASALGETAPVAAAGEVRRLRTA